MAGLQRLRGCLAQSYSALQSAAHARPLTSLSSLDHAPSAAQARPAAAFAAGSHYDGEGSGSRAYRGVFGSLMGVLASVGAAALAVTSSVKRSDCEFTEGVPAADEKFRELTAHMREFRAWLIAGGADIEALDFRPSHMGPEAGLGVYASDAVKRKLHRNWLQWLLRRKREAELASFPLKRAVTARTVVDEPGLGSAYLDILESGIADERVLVMLFFLTERSRGSDSAWAPWIAVLPKTFNTPIYFGPDELRELRGTNLFRATEVKKRQLLDTWLRIEPDCRKVLEAAGVLDADICYDDFRWAYSTFWSRAQTFPAPVQPAEGGPASEPTEGIIPGLDFCNHRFDSPVYWTIWGCHDAPSEAQKAARAKNKGQKQLPDSVKLMVPRRAAPVPGEEVTINYGDKSNEELLFLYGFTVDVNPYDTLMVSLPLPPPDEWDEAMAHRMALLQAKGLSPQIFLPAEPLDAKDDHTRAKLAGGQNGWPRGVWETVEVLVMEPEKVVRELKAVEDAEEAVKQCKTDRTRSEGEDSGLKMAVLTTLRQLLEAKKEELEGPEGTGPLEKDIRLLEASTPKQPTDIPLPPVPAAEARLKGLPYRQRCCVVYRAGQKRIARGYLRQAEQQLEAEMQRLRGILDREAAAAAAAAPKKVPEASPKQAPK